MQDPAIMLVAFGRAPYFRRTLLSLGQNPEARRWPVHVFIDGGEGSRQDELAGYVEHSPLRHATIHRRDHNLGLGINLIESRRQMFEEFGYDRVFVFEDDLVISNSYLAFTSNLMDWCESKFPMAGAAQGYSKCLYPAHWKANFLDRIHVKNDHWWGYLMPRYTWMRIALVLREYRSKFLEGVRYQDRDHAAIDAWAREKAAGCVCPGSFGSEYLRENLIAQALLNRVVTAGLGASGQDAITYLAMLMAGYVKVVPLVNRAVPIGKIGTHFNVEAWEKSKFGRMYLDEALLANDRDRKQFVWS